MATGRADFYRGSLLPSHHVIEQQLLPNLAVLAPALDNPTTGVLHFAGGAHAQPLVDALDLGLRELGQDWLDRLLRVWTPRYVQLQPLAPRLQLSAGERDALASLGSLVVAVRTDHAPLAARGGERDFEGLLVALFERAAALLGVNWRYVEVANRAEAIAGLQGRKFDVALGIIRVPGESSIEFVGPLHTSASVLIVRAGAGTTDFAHLSGRRLSMAAGGTLGETIRRRYPSIRLLELDTLENALAAVVAGRADAAAASLDVAERLMAKRFPGQLQVGNVVDNFPSEFHIAVRGGAPELALLLKRAVDAIPENERAALATQWLRTEYASGVPWQRIVLIGGPLLAALLAIGGVIIGANRRLQAEVARRKLVETELVAARDEALANATAKADFLASMAHEIRTPLTGIQGVVDLLGREPLDARPRQRLDLLQRSVRTLTRLLNDVLDFSRMQAHRVVVEAHPTDLAQLLREIVEEYQPAAGAKGIALRAGHIAPLERRVLADPLRLRQVLGNLLSNAIKFTSDGSVTLSLDVQPAAGERVRCAFSVVDTGVGIAPEARALLMQRYEQVAGTAQKHGGTGLGLAIVRELVHLMHGEVALESASGRGTTVRVTLEFALGDSITPDPVRPPLHAVSRKVLLVEDDELNRVVLSQMLSLMHCSPVAVDRASAALHELERAGLNGFVAVITDLNMPEVDGIDLARQIHTRAPDLPLIVCTADSTAATAARLRAAGVKHVVSKPIDIGLLQKTIDAALHGN